MANWLKSAQRFHVKIERGEGESASDPDGLAHFFRGAETIDVPANNTRDYKLNFLGYVEGTVDLLEVLNYNEYKNNNRSVLIEETRDWQAERSVFPFKEIDRGGARFVRRKSRERERDRALHEQ